MVTKCLLQLWVTALMVIAALGEESGSAGSKDWVNSYLKRLSDANKRKGVPAQVVYQWNDLEYDWPCEYVKTFYQTRGMYVPAENVLGGLGVYKNDTFVTVYRSSSKVPAGLNKVVNKDGKSLLQPYPNLTNNELGNCANLQFPITTNIDPNHGYMYVIDVGSVKKFPNPSVDKSAANNETEICPPKIVVLDLKNNGTIVRQHVLQTAEPRKTSFLKDIVLDYGDKNSTTVKYAYITDSGNERLIVFNFETNASWYFEHDSMKIETRQNATTGSTFNASVAINNIGLDAESEYVYYSCREGKNLSQIPTSILRDSSANFASKHRYVKSSMAPAAGLTCGNKALYFGGVNTGTVNRWYMQSDLAAQNVTKDQVSVKNETVIFEDVSRDYLIDSLRLDTNGSLWFTATASTPDPSGSQGSNYKIYRVSVNDTNSLSREPNSKVRK